jgi:toxin CcdB
MADPFDVHRNPGRNRRDAPFVVVGRSDRFGDFARRVVVPLLDVAEFGRGDRYFGRHFGIDGRAVGLDPLQIAHVPRDALGDAVASLAEEAARVVEAMRRPDWHRLGAPLMTPQT